MKKVLSILLTLSLILTSAVSMVTATETVTQVTGLSTDTEEGAVRTISPEIEIFFSAAVNESTITDITFTDSNGNDFVNSISLLDDGLTVSVKTKNLISDNEYTLSVPETVLDSNNNSIEEFSEIIYATSDLNTLFDIDFADYKNQTLTTEQLDTLTNGVVSANANTKVVVDEDGVAKVTHNDATDGTVVDMVYNLIQPVSSGCVRFDLDIAEWYYHEGGYVLCHSLRIGDNELFGVGRQGPMLYTKAGLTFTDGSTEYWPDVNGAISFKFRIEVMSADDTSDWSVNVYHTEKSLETPLLTTTIARENLSKLNFIGSGCWISKDCLDISNICYRSITATMLDLSTKVVEVIPADGKIGIVAPEVSVTFTNQIDEDTISGISVEDENRNSVVSSRSISDSKKTVTLKLANVIDGGSYTLKVDNAVVKDTLGGYVEAYEEVITALSEKDVLFNIDFADYKGQTLTTAQLNELTNGVVRSDANTKVIIDENGVAKTTDNDVETPDTVISLMYDLPKVVESGCVHFDLDIADWYYVEGGYDVAHHLLRIGNNELFGIGKGGPTLFAKSGLTFADGSNSYYPSINGAISFKFRIEVMSADETSDWTVNVYHAENSLDTPILTTTIVRENLLELTDIGSAYWVSSENYDISNISYNSISATLVDLSTKVSEVNPADGKIGTVSPEVKVAFTNPIDDSTLNGITVEDENGKNVVSSRSISDSKKTVTLKLANVVDRGSYALKVDGTVVKDVVGGYVKSYEKAITADAAEDVLFNIDFADYKGQTLTTAQLNTLTNGVVRSDANTKVIIDENGVAKTTDNDLETSDAVLSLVYDLPQAVESGCVHFDLDIADWWYNEGGFDIAHHCIKLGNNELFGVSRQGPMLYGKDGLTFADGSNSYYPSINGAISFKFRIEVMSADETSDWTVNVYHTENSLDTPILTTTITRENLLELTDIGSAYWVSSGNYDISNISYNSISATLVDLSTKVSEVNPADGKIGTVSPEIKVAFTNPIDDSTLNGITVEDENGKSVVSSRSISDSKKTVTLKLANVVDGGSYALKVDGTVVKDVVGGYVKSYEKVITADAAEDVLFNIDFADYKGQTLTTEQLNTLTNGVVRSDANTKVIIDENGVAKTTDNDVETPDTVISLMYDLPKVVESGCVHFDLDIADWYYVEGGYDVAHHLLRIGNNELFGIGKTGPTLFTKSGLTFADGSNSYYPSINGAISFKFRIEVMSADETSDWTVNVYHTENSLELPILTTTIARANLLKLTDIGSSYWVSSDYYDSSHISYNSISASFGKYTRPVVAYWDVKDTQGNKITSNLNGATEFNVNISVVEPGGVFYVGVYEGDKLVEIKFLPITEAGLKTFNFTNMTTSETTRLTGFYWDDNMSPILKNPIDLLN